MDNKNQVRIMAEGTCVKEKDGTGWEGMIQVMGTAKNILIATTAVYKSLLEKQGPIGRGKVMADFADMISGVNEEFAHKLDDEDPNKLLEDIAKEIEELFSDKEEKE